MDRLNEESHAPRSVVPSKARAQALARRKGTLSAKAPQCPDPGLSDSCLIVKHKSAGTFLEFSRSLEREVIPEQGIYRRHV